MAILSGRFEFSVTDTLGNTHRARVDPRVTVDGRASDQTFTVAASTTVTLYDATADACADFDFLWIESDKDVMLELITDQNDGVGKRSATVEVVGGGPPVIRGSDDSYANYTTNFGGGTLDVVDKILCRNLGTETATVRRVVVT